MSDPSTAITFVPAITYRDPKTAIDWLTKAFGLELIMAIEGPEEDPTQCHYEMDLDGQGRVMVGAEWNPQAKSPASIDGVTTASIHVAITTDVDAHCERARAAGATILSEPEDQFYGDRVYRCADPEGHHWTFSQAVRRVTLAEAEAAIGQPIMATKWP